MSWRIDSLRRRQVDAASRRGIAAAPATAAYCGMSNKIEAPAASGRISLARSIAAAVDTARMLNHHNNNNDFNDVLRRRLLERFGSGPGTAQYSCAAA